VGKSCVMGVLGEGGVVCERKKITSIVKKKVWTRYLSMGTQTLSVL